MTYTPKFSSAITDILQIPDVGENAVYTARWEDLPKTLKSRYFPEWFFCPKCRQLHKLETWEQLWNGQFPQDGRFKDNYPACHNCSKRRGERQIRRSSLEQIRFCMASLDSGKLEDIPFEKLFDDNVNLNQMCCDISNIQGGGQNFTYHTLSTSAGLQSIYVKGANGKRITMAQIASPYIVTADGAFKLVVRNQNNVYYPNVIRSLYIPQSDELIRHQERVLQLHNKNHLSIQQISDSFNLVGIHLSPHDVQSIIDNNDLDFDFQEYRYITDEGNYNQEGINRSTDGEYYAILYRNLKAPFIKKMYAIHRLKETAVIPSYTRISPAGTEELWWDRVHGQETKKYPEIVSTFRTDTNFIPGVESYGEGIFFDIDVDTIDVNDRAIFVHTFSHIIMKEMEYQCGYPLSSLKEKMYYNKDDDSQYGILIYTIGGSEGSYGGLVSLLPSDSHATNGGKIVTLIKNALERAKDCPNDPICINEEGDKQGHCFACVDIPEISCSNWNKGLNRRVVLKYASATPSTPMANTSEIDLAPHTSTNEVPDIVAENNIDDDDILA